MTDAHYICTSTPDCLCVGGTSEIDECCCFAARDDSLVTECEVCEAEMVAIDFETGEPLTVHPLAVQ